MNIEQLREAINYEAAWELYYFLAERRKKEGLTYLMLCDVIDAALHLPTEGEA